MILIESIVSVNFSYFDTSNNVKIKTMKKNSIKILCNILLCSVLFVSCSNDDDDIKPNTPPAAFSLTTVVDKATNVGLLPDLSWQTATDADGDTITYDLYLGTEETPQLYKENIKDTHFKVTEELIETTQYYWKVIAKDSNNGTAESEIFSFITLEKPGITSLSSTDGIIGMRLRINGYGFSEIKEENKVTFNGVEAEISYTYNDRISVIVPDATTGPVVVTVNGFSSEDTPLFTYVGDAMSCEDFGKLTVTNFKMTDINELTYEMDMNNTGDGYIDLTNVTVQNYLSEDDQLDNDDVGASGGLVSFDIMSPGETMNKKYKVYLSDNAPVSYSYLIVKVFGYNGVEICTEEIVIIEKIE